MGLQGKPGRLVDTPSHLVDILATLVDVGGAVYPKENRGSTITPMEGRSLVPYFGAEVPASVPRDLFWEHEGNAAVRSGDWKLVRAGRSGSWELYDIGKDRTELHDLSGEQPERVHELASKWNAWAERARVLPYPGGKMKSEVPAAKGNRKPK